MKKLLVWSVLSSQILILLLVGHVFAGTVGSASILVADGVTGQDTTTGAGIKTGHIQNGAVTASKLADGAVSGTNIQSGAVTDDKISGQISSSKISSVGLDADTIDGLHASQLGFERNYSNIVIVAKQGGDFDNLLDALNSITDSSEQNPYLIKFMPGIYDSPAGTYYLKNYVDIQGSGKSNTKIILHGTLNGSDINMTIGYVTIDVQGSGLSCTSGYNYVTGMSINGTINNVNFENMELKVSNASSGTVLIGTGDINIDNSVISNNTNSCDAGIGILLTTGAYNNNVYIKNSKINGGYSSNSLNRAIVANSSNNANVFIYSSNIASAQSIVNGAGMLRLFVYDSFLIGYNIYYNVVGVDSTDELKAVNTQFDGNTAFPTQTNIKLLNCYNKNYDPISYQ